LWDREGYVENEGLKLRYLERGKGKPVLLLHGFGDSAEVWEFVIPHLKGAFRIIALDQRGHGESSRASPEAYTTLHFVSDIEALRRELGLEGFSLVGHSMGGRNALVYSAMYGDGVRRLVVIDYGPELAPEGRRRILRALRIRPDRFRLEEMAEALMEENPRLDLHKALQYLTRVTRPTEDGLFTWRCDLRLLQRMREGKRVIRDIDLWEFLPKVKTPTLLLRGELSDLLSPEGARRTVEALPLARLREIPRAGHAVILDNPEDTARAIGEFLS